MGVRIAALGDLHFSRTSAGSFQKLLSEIAAAADVLLVPGDLTDYGLPDEARALARELAQAARIPVVGVLGNHDYESGHAPEVVEILREGGMIILDGDACEIHGIGIAGVKGFCGGFGRHTLGSWGEPLIKSFVQECLAEALKLETALSRLRTATKIALLHYADGAKSYILAPARLRVGAVLESGPNADIKPGNALPLANIPTGTLVHAVELQPGQGARMARSAGSSIQLVAKDGDHGVLRLPSGELRRVLLTCRATVGQVGNSDHANQSGGKCGPIPLAEFARA